MSKFTKGPWRSEFFDGEHSEGHIYDSKDNFIVIITGRNYGCNFGGFEGDWSTSSPDAEDDIIHEANLNLISAAPDMYEALTVMTSLVRLKYGNLDKEVEAEINKALAALAKADGKGE